MEIVKKYPHGFFCWVTLETRDIEDAKVFYRDLFGWDVAEVPVGDSQKYALFQIDGYDIAGVYTTGEEASNWCHYVNVDDINEVIGRVVQCGGTVVYPPMALQKFGVAAVIKDPGGAYVGLWQANDMIGAELVSRIGALTWNELMTRHVVEVRKFYSELFKWELSITPSPSGGEGEYTSIMNEGRLNGGILEMNAEWGDIPSHWQAYFGVDNEQEMVKKCEALGGKVYVRMELDKIGKVAVVADRQDAVFVLFEAAEGAYEPIPTSWQ